MNTDSNLSLLRKLVWLYFILLILEGALRKWILPQYSNILFLVRDPVVILIFLTAMAKGVFPGGALVMFCTLLGLLSFAAGLMADGNTFTVALFGWRSNFLHLPLIFLLPRIFSINDVIRMGKTTLWISGPMAVLVVAQFNAPISSWLNITVGGGFDNMMSGAHVRPPGTFSFTTGMVAFTGFLSCFVFWQLADGRGFGKVPFMMGLISLVICLSVSGSRSAVVEVLVVFVGLALVWLFQGKLVGQLFKYLPILAVSLVSVSYLTFVGRGLEVLGDRFSEGGAGGLFVRILSGFFAPLQFIDSAPLLGYGLGMGTNVGAYLRTGNRDFLLAEGEWSRVVLESGIILGFAFLIYRVVIMVYLLKVGFRVMQHGNALAPLLCVLGAMHVLTDQFGQATSLGFTVLIAGLGLAAAEGVAVQVVQPVAGFVPVALRKTAVLRGKTVPEGIPLTASTPLVVGGLVPDKRGTPPASRGRSVFARRLHDPVQPKV